MSIPGLTLYRFLEGYRYDPSEVHIKQEGSNLEVQVSGLWYRTILWEVPLLCLISELYYSMKGLQREDDETIIQKTIEKEKSLKRFRFLLQNSEQEEGTLTEYTD